MPSYKLIYFDARGRAEVCRLLFALSGQKYEDFRFSMEEWPNHKPNTPFGQIPVLEIDGKPFAQSVALEAYLAREFGYYGKTNLERLQIDQVVQLVADVVTQARKAHFPTDETKKDELTKNFREVDVPKFMGYFEKLLKENGSGYFVGDSLTVADLSLYSAVHGLSQFHPNVFDKSAEVNALIARVESNEKIKAYLAARKPTKF